MIDIRVNRTVTTCAVIILITSTILLINSSASTSRAITNKMNVINDAQQIFLGSASLQGDGIENNTIIDLEAETKIIFEIESKATTLDFYITYSMECTGLTDSGLIVLLVQINKENKGSSERITLDTSEGIITVEGVEVKRGDILSFEIGATYANVVPPFTVVNYTFGGGLLHMSAWTKIDTIFSLIERFIPSSIVTRLKSCITDTML